MSGCAAPDCERSHEARGMCHLHYMRWYRNGGFEVARPEPPKPAVLLPVRLARPYCPVCGQPEAHWAGCTQGDET